MALLLCSSAGRSQPAQIPADSGSFQPRHLDNNGTFGLGEKLVFDVRYGFITAGQAGLEILPEPVTYRGARCYHIHTWARSSRSFSRIFKVEDGVHAYMDSQGIFSWYFQKSLNEGSYHDTKIVDYDHENGRAYLSDDGAPSDTSEIPPYVQNIITALYYTRLLPLEVGKSFHVETHDIRMTYPLKINVLEYETIKVPAGTFNCYKLEPTLESEGIFKQKGRIFIWLTDDQYRMPVMMRSEVLIGAISADLREFSRGTPVAKE